MQHRFTLTLFLLALPFLAFYFVNPSKKKSLMGILFAASAFCLSFIYNSRGVTPVPRLQDQSVTGVAKTIKENSSAGSGLLVDSWSFESTYYVAFLSGLPQDHIAVFDQNSTSVESEMGKAIAILDTYPTGCILIHKNGKLLQEMAIENNHLLVKKSGQRLLLNKLSETEEVTVYSYRKE
jgi:hypothetical protein